MSALIILSGEPMSQILQGGIILNKLKIPMPEEFLKNIYAKIPPRIKITFIATFIFGLVTHLYMFTNKFSYPDYAWQFFQLKYTATSGRWLIPLPEMFRGDLSMPWVIGLFSVLYISVSACIVTEIAGLKKKISSILTGIIMVTFPAISATMTYTFTASSYCFSLLLACFSVYITKYKYGCVISIILLTCSLGIYQAYFPTAIFLFVLLILKDLLDDYDFMKIFKKSFSYICVLITSLVMYIFITAIITRNTGINAYMNIHKMGSTLENYDTFTRCLTESFYAVKNIFTDDVFMFYGEPSFFQTATKIFIISAFLITGYICINIFVKTKIYKNTAKSIIYFLLLIAVLISCGFVWFYNPSYVYMVMVYGASCIFVFILFMLERYNGRGRAVVNWVVTVALCVQIYNFFIYANDLYLETDIGFKRGCANAVMLANDIKNFEEYNTEIEIVIVGYPEDDLAYSDNFRLFKSLYAYDDFKNDIRRSNAYGEFIKIYTGLPNEINVVFWIYGRGCDEDYISYDTTKIATAADKEFIDIMPIYPQKGAIQYYNGRIFVKMCDLPGDWLNVIPYNVK
jgi:heme A synthase